MIRSFSQKNYKNTLLGTCTDTIAKSGCKLVCYSILTGIEPLEMNRRFVDAGVFVQGCLIDDRRAIDLLGLQFDPRRDLVVKYPTIGCTNFYANKGVPQHFFVIIDSKTILDPLDGAMKAIDTYPIISYRNVTTNDQIPEEVYMTEEQFREHVQNVINGFYLNYYKRQGRDAEIQSHVNAIMATHAAEQNPYCLSDWINRQMSEPEFLQNWGNTNDVWKIQAIAKLKELVTSLGG